MTRKQKHKKGGTVSRLNYQNLPIALADCPICGRVLPQCSISVGGSVSVCPGCIDEWRRRNDPSEVRMCVICGEPTTTPYTILSGGEVTCCEECDDAHLQSNEFLYGDDEVDIRPPAHY